MLVKNDRSKCLKSVQVSKKPLNIKIIGQFFLSLFEVQLLRVYFFLALLVLDRT